MREARRELQGRTVLLTGASRGLGAHMARTLASAGARVALAARNQIALERVAEAIRSSGGEAFVAQLDLLSAASINAAIDSVEAGFGPIDILVNNAGITASAPVLEHSESDWDAVLATNLKAPFLVATEVARRMRLRGHGGSIVNVASILGLRQAGSVAAYSASKSALIQLTRTLALELARYGIRVNAIAPGYIETDINREFFATEAGRALIKRIPQRRLGRPQDLDGPLLLLAGDASAFMTGSVVVVDGGHLVNSL
jgi:NAD(P)-dependent dehydrogenase (short-subunit alcohol dehydrogenase family)